VEKGCGHVKKLFLVASLVGSAALSAQASAQTPEPVPPSGTIGASNAGANDDSGQTSGTAGAGDGAGSEETYLPGPGGGELPMHGTPPLESTGLEDGPAGCKCSSALGARPDSISALVALAVSVTLWRRRRGSAATTLP